MASAIQPGFTGSGIVAGESWSTRLREGAYTSPSGTRIRYNFEDVGREFDKRTAAFDFVGVNESYVQRNGSSSRRYPLRCIFWGKDCDLQATAFEAALLEDGIGKLEHPIYGTFNVVPFGTVTRRDDLKTAANQSIVEVTFWTTLESVYPSANVDPQSEILSAIAGFDVSTQSLTAVPTRGFSIAAARQFATSVDVASTVNRANLKASIRKFLREANAKCEAVTAAVRSVDRAFHDVQSLVNFGLDVLIGQPLQLALLVSNMLRAPGRALIGIASRLDAYQRLLDSIIGSIAATPAETLAAGQALALRTTAVSNDFHASDLFMMNTVAASVNATVADPINADGQTVAGGNFTKRADALLAAAAIADQLDAAVAHRDAGFAALKQIPKAGSAQTDTGESFQGLQDAVSRATSYLVKLSFTLLPEKRIVLDRARTIIDLAAQLYPNARSVDEKLDSLINTNDLTGSEILELPAGRVIAYYP